LVRGVDAGRNPDVATSMSCFNHPRDAQHRDATFTTGRVADKRPENSPTYFGLLTRRAYVV
jgi:hypothetical protein